MNSKRAECRKTVQPTKSQYHRTSGLENNHSTAIDTSELSNARALNVCALAEQQLRSGAPLRNRALMQMCARAIAFLSAPEGGERFLRRAVPTGTHSRHA